MSGAPNVQTFSHYPSWPPPLRLPLVTIGEQECPYLPARQSMNRVFVSDRLDPELYHDLMDAGFRRSGKYIYQPACRGCRECRPIRVLVDRFRPSRSQRRCLGRNSDLAVTLGPARATDENFELYQRYVRHWHGRSDPESRADFQSFLYSSPVKTVQSNYRDGRGNLIAAGICDMCTRSLSSVYFYFDPSEARRGLGTFGALREIGEARARGIAYYYLGFYVAQCGAMSYKASFRPCQILDTDGIWRDSLTKPRSEVHPGRRIC